MQNLIKNNWCRPSGCPFVKAKILSHDVHPEGLDVERILFVETGSYSPKSSVGHIISVLRGGGKLYVTGDDRSPFQVQAGVHVYLPHGDESQFDVEPHTELLQVSSASADQAHGDQMLLRDETYLASCASGSHSLRWILTPQYLSRRIFLHHDLTLLSKSGNPVSWFRTTMFDVAGLPANEDGEPVFKMCYNSRTEFNVCYNVKGTARVRMARHPYSQENQMWGPWLTIDNDSTYHVNEVAGSFEGEACPDPLNGKQQYHRNKHEVSITDGYVTLFCLFDPAPTGVERHRPGEYSDYEPLSQVIRTSTYRKHQQEIARYDVMVDQLSLAKAMGDLDKFRETPYWELCQSGGRAQIHVESELVKSLVVEGKGRERVLAPWTQTTDER